MTNPTPGPVPRVQRELERLRAASPPAPDAKWRAEARQRFVAGSATTTATRTHIRGAFLWPALAAAAAFAILFAPPAAGPAWNWAGSSGDGVVRVGDLLIPVQDSVALSRALTSGASVEVPEGTQLDVQMPGVALLQITGGTHSTLPKRSGRWYGHELVASLAVGELRVTTGEKFHGTRLVVQTEGSQTWITGTTLAVIRGADSTCVCVFEGKVAVHSAAGLDTVFAGTRRIIPDRTFPARVEPIRPMETMKLSMLRGRIPAAPVR